MSPTIRDLDVEDDAEFSAFCGVYARAVAAETPGLAQYGEDESRPYFRPTADAAPVALVALVGELLVGQAIAFMTNVGRVHRARVQVLVDPAHRRRGVGTALADALLARVANAGRTLLDAQVALPAGAGREHPYCRFAERLGFHLGNVEVTRELRLPVPGLDETAAEIAPHHAGYTLRTLEGGIPDDLLPGFLAVNNLVAAEAPSGDLEVTADEQTPESFRRKEAVDREAGRSRLVTLALAPDGDVVAATSLSVSTQDHLDQWGTIVRRDHRGHRLGLAVKVANLRAAQRLHPDKVRVQGTNAETNTHMIAINERLGFEVVATFAEYQRRLDDDRARRHSDG